MNPIETLFLHVEGKNTIDEVTSETGALADDPSFPD